MDAACNKSEGRPHDLWNATPGVPLGRPAVDTVNADACEPAGFAPYPVNVSGCRYEDEIFTQAAVDAVNGHDASTPMFCFSPRTRFTRRTR